MKPLQKKTIRLAVDTLQIGILVLETYAGYTSNIRMYRASSLTALSSILEALSGVFCELARQQEADEPVQNLYRGFKRNKNPLVRVRSYLKNCLCILNEDAGQQNKAKPFTAMYLEAQVLANMVVEFESRGA